MNLVDIPPVLRQRVLEGMVIPAHPLALTAGRRLDERRQRALTRYYLDAGAGGVAVAVHTTQFAIRDPMIGLLDPVLTLAAETVDAWLAHRAGQTEPVGAVGASPPGLPSKDGLSSDAAVREGSAPVSRAVAGVPLATPGFVQELPGSDQSCPPASVGGTPTGAAETAALPMHAASSWLSKGGPILKVAGLCGDTAQAVQEVQLALDRGYHAGLLSLSALRDASVNRLIDHCREVAAGIPIFGFYLQPAVGGRVLPHAFWRRFVELDNVLAIKIAPFNRYQTLEVVRAVAEARRPNPIALYTGNDDQIVLDLLTEFRFDEDAKAPPVRIVGGLLGHWAAWTRGAVTLLEEIRRLRRQTASLDAAWLTRAAQITDANAAFFDAANGFRGCIAGIHEVLRRQGLLAGTWCLDPAEGLSPGQAREIDRVYAAYPSLNDDAFVARHLDEWLRD